MASFSALFFFALSIVFFTAGTYIVSITASITITAKSSTNVNPFFIYPPSIYKKTKKHKNLGNS